MISVEKPDFRTALIEGDSVRKLDPYWQRIMVKQADAINILGRTVAAMEIEIATLKQYNLDHP